MLKNNRQVTSVSLAITPDLLYVVQAGSQDGRLAILKSGSEPTPAGCFQQDTVADPQQLGRTIRSLWSRLGLRERTVSVVLPSSLCSLRSIRLPDFPAPERRAVVRGELEHIGALPFHGGAFDFLWVSEGGQGETALAEAFALYTSDEVVAGIRSILRFADLKLAALEPMSIAVLRACSLGETVDTPSALLCLDDAATDFAILDEGGVRYLRHIPSGWTDLHAHVNSEQPGVSFGGSGIAADVPPPDRTAPSGSLAGGGAPFLVTETVRSMAYYSRIRGSSLQPTRLRIPATPADFTALTALFGEATVPPLTPLDPSTMFGVNPPAHPSLPAGTLAAHSLATIGTAAGSLGMVGVVPRIDLAQDDPTTRVVNPWATALPGTLIGSAAGLVLAIGAWSALTAQIEHAANQKQLLNARAVQIRAQQAPLLQQQRLQDRVRLRRAGSDLPVAALLGHVAASFTRDISVNTLTVEADGSVSMSGAGLTSDGIQRFAFALASGQTLREPRIDTLRQEAPDRLSFRIVGTIATKTAKRRGGGS